MSPILTRIYTSEDFGYLQVYLSISVFLSALPPYNIETCPPTPARQNHAANVLTLGMAAVFISTGLCVLFSCLLLTTADTGTSQFRACIAHGFRRHVRRRELQLLPAGLSANISTTRLPAPRSSKQSSRLFARWYSGCCTAVFSVKCSPTSSGRRRASGGLLNSFGGKPDAFPSGERSFTSPRLRGDMPNFRFCQPGRLC